MSTFNLILDFFLDQPLESHALRIKPEFNIIPEQRSQLENSIDSVLEADDFMEFSRLIEAVIEFHSLKSSQILRHIDCFCLFFLIWENLVESFGSDVLVYAKKRALKKDKINLELKENFSGFS